MATHLRERRSLASTSSKIPLELSQDGLLFANGKVGDVAHSFLVDTSFPGVLFSCKPSGASDASCPETCTYLASVSISYPNGGFGCVDKKTAALQLGDAVSVASFPMGLIPYSYDSFFQSKSRATVDSVLGLGLPEFLDDPKVATELAGNLASKWASYSIYLSPSGKSEGSFVLTSGVDATLTKGKAEFTIPAVTGAGYAFDMTDYLLDGARSSAVSCSSSASTLSQCRVLVNSASPIMVLSSKAWDELDEYVDWYSYGCGLDYIGNELVYICKADAALPRLGFTFGDKTFFLEKEHYTVPVAGSASSKIAVLIYYDSLNPTTWTLGVPFFRAFYSAYDTKSRAVTFYCTDGESCIKDYVPLKEPLKATTEAPPTDTPSSTEDWTYPTSTPYTYSYTPSSTSNYGAAKNKEISNETTSSSSATAFRTAGFIFGVLGVILLATLAVYGNIRKKNRAKEQALRQLAPPPPENEFSEEILTPASGAEQEINVAVAYDPIDTGKK